MGTIEIRIGGKIYRLGSELAKDEAFIGSFIASSHLRDNYDLLELTFPEDAKFALYNKNLLNDAFIEAYYSEDNFIPFELSGIITLIDPIANPAFTSSKEKIESSTSKRKKVVDISIVLTSGYQERLQNILFKVFKKYGKVGLDKLRKMNIANVVNDLSYNLEEINKNLGKTYSLGELMFNDDFLDIETRINDALKSDALNQCKNENVLAAVVYLSELLYQKGELISEVNIKSLIQSIENQYPENVDNKLNQNDFLIAMFLCSEYHLDTKQEMIRKGK